MDFFMDFLLWIFVREIKNKTLKNRLKRYTIQGVVKKNV